MLASNPSAIARLLKMREAHLELTKPQDWMDGRKLLPQSSNNSNDNQKPVLESRG